MNVQHRTSNVQRPMVDRGIFKKGCLAWDEIAPRIKMQLWNQYRYFTINVTDETLLGRPAGRPNRYTINVYGYAGQGDRRVAPTVSAKIKMSVVIIFLKETADCMMGEATA